MGRAGKFRNYRPCCRARARNSRAAAGISSNVRERIRDLEQSLSEERRALEEVEQRSAELERKYPELLQLQR